MRLKNTYQARKRFTRTPVKSTGMWYQDKDVVVPSNRITMKGPQGQPDYFKEPILGVGMQSGQTQVMQPGREYSFPNDQYVFETRMQNGGETSTETNPTKMDPIYITARRRNQDYRSDQDNTRINNQIVPVQFRGRRYVQPTLSEYVEPSIGSRVLDALANPMTALSSNNTGSRNPFDYALDMVNPASWIQSGEKAVGNLARGEYTDAALNALGAIPGAVFLDDVARVAAKNPKLVLAMERATPVSTKNITLSPGLKRSDVQSFTEYISKSPKKSQKVLEEKFLKGLGKGSKSLQTSIDKRVADLKSKEGFKRLVAQEKEYFINEGEIPSVADELAKSSAKARIDELDNTVNLNEEARKSILNDRFASSPLTEESSLYSNAFFRKGLDAPKKSSTDNTILLKKVKPNYYQPNPGSIGMGYNLVGNKPVEMHEIGHALQRGRTLPVDDVLKKIEPKQNLRNNIENAYEYFNTGSKGKESSAFAHELREAMFQKGFIPDYYSPISEDQVQSAYKYFKKNPMGVYDKNTGKFLSNTRIFDFMKPSKANSKLLTDVLNKLPVAAPIAAGVGASQLQEKKYGGWLNSYQDGGLFPVGPYDEMMAPKEGNYLQPDINRPSYVDNQGYTRSEYKMGFNIDGKETLLPTVVDGRQLSPDQAIDNYYRTGLHMGQYDSPQQADYRARLRTAKYNMLKDPARFNINDF